MRKTVAFTLLCGSIVLTILAATFVGSIINRAAEVLELPNE